MKTGSARPNDGQSQALSVAGQIAAAYGALPQVEAVALAGSQTTGAADKNSDLDLYVYVQADIPIAVRTAIAMAQSECAEVDNRFWEPGDEWLDRETQIGVDVMFRQVSWIEDQLDRVLKQYQATVGYSTCFWHNVRTSSPLFDRQSWFRNLQQTAAQDFPEPLRRAIIAKNHPILRNSLSSYTYQLQRAVNRNDRVSINHRVAALLASYFDILFAVNRQTHPGEKRLLTIANEQCSQSPHDMKRHVEALVNSVASGGRQVLVNAEVLVDGLDQLLRQEGLMPI